MIVAGVLIVLWIIVTYNKLVVIRQNVRESWSAIDTELRRRYDLIPNLVETVKGYASHEHDTLEAVVKARNSAVAAPQAVESQVAAQNQLSGALSRLFALSESYPELKANENFNRLQAELTETETRISQARRFYNANVREMNSAVESFPTVLIAPPLGFRAQSYFGLDDPAAAEPVKVSFSSNNRSSQASGGAVNSISSQAEGTKLELGEKHKEI
jgi:LemA protein